MGWIGRVFLGIMIFRFAWTSTMEVGMTSWPALKNTRKSCREIEKQGKMEGRIHLRWLGIIWVCLTLLENTISWCFISPLYFFLMIFWMILLWYDAFGPCLSLLGFCVKNKRVRERWGTRGGSTIISPQVKPLIKNYSIEGKEGKKWPSNRVLAGWLNSRWWRRTKIFDSI